MSEITEDSFRCPSSRSFPRPLLFGGAGLGEVAAVAGVGAQRPDRLRRHEAGADHPPLGDLGEPDRVGPVGFGPARQRLDLRGVVQLAAEPAGFQQEERRLPVVAGSLHADLGDTPAGQPVSQRLQLAAGGAEGPCLLLPAARGGAAGHPDGDLHRGLADIQAGDPLGEQRLIFDVLH